MAVYEGARPRSILLPRSRPRLVEAPTLPRRRMRGAVRARRRSSRLSFVLGGIVLAFMLAFFSLAQSVRVAATGYDINDLLEEQQQLIVRKQELLSDLNRPPSPRSASCRSTRASVSWSSRSSSPSADRPIDRCSDGRIPAAASCSSWSPSR